MRRDDTTPHDSITTTHRIVPGSRMNTVQGRTKLSRLSRQNRYTVMGTGNCLYIFRRGEYPALPCAYRHHMTAPLCYQLQSPLPHLTLSLLTLHHVIPFPIPIPLKVCNSAREYFTFHYDLFCTHPARTSYRRLRWCRERMMQSKPLFSVQIFSATKRRLQQIAMPIKLFIILLFPRG